MRSTQFAPMTPSVVSTLPSWLRVLSELVSRIPGAMFAGHARGWKEAGFLGGFYRGGFAEEEVLVDVKSLFRRGDPRFRPGRQRRKGDITTLDPTN